MDRVELLSTGREASASAILGHVLAHEIGHVLLGTTKHSDSGLMKAWWTPDQIGGMRVIYQGFTSSEAEMVHRNVIGARLSASDLSVRP
jgi:hypothetical protein